jgi:CspA family cold shock protein
VTDRETGTIKWFDPDKGYGFIERDHHGGDVFVHMTGISEGAPYRTLSEGQRVEFTVVQGNKGPKAENVVIVA